MKSIPTLLRELTAIPGVSSQEDQVIEYMYKALSTYSSDIMVDKLGNVICHFPSSKKNTQKVMIFAHTDEIGFIVRKVEKDGFLRVERIGGVNINVLPGLRVDVLGKSGIITGVIGVKSHHFMKADEKGVLSGTDNLYIDIGARSEDDAAKLGVKVGTFVCFHSEFIERHDGTLTNKAMDNRVGCTVLLTLAQYLVNYTEQLEWDVYLVACVQEEFNIRGILPAVRRIRPDVSIGIDVTPSCDTPDLHGFSDVVIDQGPAITCMNFHGRGTLAGVLPDNKLFNHLTNIADNQSIKYQLEVALGVITENAFIMFEEIGIATASVSIPTRYTHTPIETVSPNDVELTAELLRQFIFSLKVETKFGKGIC